jgi:hypothetical protein
VTAVAAAIRGDGLGAHASGLWGWIGDLGGSPPGVHVVNVELMDDGAPHYESEELRMVRVMQQYRLHWKQR